MVSIDKIGDVIHSFSGRLLIALLLVQTIFLPVLFWGILNIMSESLRNQFINEIRSATGLLATQLIPYDPIEDHQKIIGLFDEIMLGGRVNFVELVLPGDVSIKGRIPPILPIAGFREDYQFGEHRDSIYFLTIPVDFSTLPQPAMLRLGWDEAPTATLIKQVYFRSAWFALVYVIISLILVGLVG